MAARLGTPSYSWLTGLSLSTSLIFATFGVKSGENGDPCRRVFRRISINLTMGYEAAMSNLYAVGWHAYNTEFRTRGRQIKPVFLDDGR